MADPSKPTYYNLMPRKKRPRPNNYPTIPPFHDPENYTWVQSKEGGHWRRKRGTVKRARLNASFQLNADTTIPATAAARRMIQRLQPFLRFLETGRITARFSGVLKKSIAKNNRIDFSLFHGFEIQKYHQLADLAPRAYFTSVRQDEVVIEIAIHDNTMKPEKKGATEYYFEAIWLYGDPTEENALRIDSVMSPLYPMRPATETTCQLRVPRPDKRPYMIFLKASCHIGNMMADAPCFYGMRVVSAV